MIFLIIPPHPLSECEEYAKLAVKKFSITPLVLDPETFEFEVPQCDYTVPLIVDGEKTKPGEFPHMAALGWQRDINDGGGVGKMECWRGKFPYIE